MARMHKWLGLAALSLSLTGCVSQEKYNALKLERDQLAEQVGSADADAKSARAQADAYKSQLDQIMQNQGGKDGLVQNLNAQIQDLNRQLSDIKGKYEDALSKPPTVINGTALPAPLSNELSQFAAANPDLVDFDAARGLVKFKSDVTFALGSAELSSRAHDVLKRFSAILNSPAAASYELMVAGHTDSTPVSNPATIKAGHKDNWYLSSHRAITVASAMVGDGVNRHRLGVAGYADERPIASNATESGKAQNRRVEVLILPTTVHGGSPSVASASPNHAKKTTKKGEFNKDGGTAAVEMGK
jgi:chemotaxis protein MotB